MSQPILGAHIVAALQHSSHAFPQPPTITQIVARWDILGAPGFQCLPEFRPGMAGEVGKFVRAWKRYQKSIKLK